MNNNNRLHHIFLFLLKIFYLLIPIAVLFFIISPWFEYLLTSIKMCTVVLISIIIFAHIYHSFDIGNYDISKLFTAQIIITFFQYIIIQFTLWTNDRNYLNLVNTLIYLLSIFISYFLITIILTKYKHRFIGKKNTIIITTNNNHDVLMKQINRVTNIYKILNVYNDNTFNIDNINEYDQSINTIIVDEIDPTIKNKIINYGFFNHIEVIVIPTIEDILIKNGYDVHFIDSPFLVLSSFGPRLYERIIKRIIDLIGSILLFIIASPIFIIVAIAIKSYDKGPVLYTQDRLTTNGKIFKVYKFRSMIVNAEANGVQLAKINDSRITPIGNILRKYRLDELPQLLNIIKGDMSFVGPRPERPIIARNYEAELPEFKYRLKVKAGLTGYAQIFGRYNTTPKDKLKLDLMYISKYNLLLDIELIFKTIQILFEKESTEGF